MAASPPAVHRPEVGFAERTRRLVRLYLGLPDGAPVPGEPLVSIFSAVAATVADRVDLVPERNLLAFLEFVGVSPNPPQPARTPVSFELATGTVVDALVPAG